jgi:hypothetical protein
MVKLAESLVHQLIRNIYIYDDCYSRDLRAKLKVLKDSSSGCMENIVESNPCGIPASFRVQEKIPS